MSDAVLKEIRDLIGQAVANRAPLAITGSGSKSFYGQTPVGTPLSVAGLQGIVAYEPTELVVTARAGTPLSELSAALADKGQMLPFEPPCFNAGGSVGGMVAAGLSGPRRAAAGAVRDFVLGCCLIDARGQWLQFGGQVMKNVAGYDVSRLLTGSLGILGVIAEVSLKVLPVPALERSLSLAANEREALRLMNEWAGQPLPISATHWHEGQLKLRFSGAASVVDQACRDFIHKQGASELDEASAFWAQLRDHRLDFFASEGATPLWRLSLPATTAPIDLPGDQIIEWGGSLRWWRTDAPVAQIRRAAADVGGSASLFRGGDKTVGVFEALPEPLANIHRRLKTEFDPNGIFNPGRLYPDL